MAQVTNITDPLVASSGLVMEESSGGSHCWEEDGSLHSVCIFVFVCSGVCSLATVITVYRVILMIIQAVREPNNVNESLRKYKLQPLTNSKASECPKEGESMEMSRLKQEAGAVEAQDNVNSIQLVESTMVTMGEPEETEADQSCNSQSRDWLC